MFVSYTKRVECFLHTNNQNEKPQREPPAARVVVQCHFALLSKLLELPVSLSAERFLIVYDLNCRCIYGVRLHKLERLCVVVLRLMLADGYIGFGAKQLI